MNDRRATILKYEDYVAGWLNSSIRDFLAVFPRDKLDAIRLDHVFG